MAAEIPSKEPELFRAGDTIKWKRSLSDYKASESWVLKNAFRGTPGVIDITSSASGDDHLVNEVAATTAAYSPGIYDVIGFVVFHVQFLHCARSGARTVSGGLDGVKKIYRRRPLGHRPNLKAGPIQPVFVAQASSEMLFAPVFVGFSKVVGPAGFDLHHAHKPLSKLLFLGKQPSLLGP